MSKNGFGFWIEAEDWRQEFVEVEPDVTGEEAAIREQMDNGLSPAQMGRMLLVGRELDIAPDDILPDNKPLLNLAASTSWAQRLQKRKKRVDLDNGKEVEVRQYVGPMTNDDQEAEPDEAGTRWVESQSEAATHRAMGYLTDIVPGHIKGRLNIIAANRGDVRAAADLLIAEIERIVGQLT